MVAYQRPFIRSKRYFGPERRRAHTPNFAGPEWRFAKGEVINQRDIFDKVKAQTK